MTRGKITAATLMMGATMLTTGCASTMEAVGADTVKKQGCLIGTAGGALAGAAIGSQVDNGSTRNILIGAGIGAAAGYFAGCNYGQLIENRRAQYANNADFYEAQIQNASLEATQLEADNASLQQDISTAKTVVARLETETMSEDQKKELAKKTLAANKKALSEYNKRTTKIGQEIELQETLLVEMKSTEGQSEKATKLQKQIDEMKTRNAELTANIEVLTAQNDQIGGFL